MKFCEKNDIHMISDEIYALSVYDTGCDLPTFTSSMSIDQTGLIDKDRLHILYGMSKVGACSMLRRSWLMIEPGLRIRSSTFGKSDNPERRSEESCCSKHEVS